MVQTLFLIIPSIVLLGFLTLYSIRRLRKTEQELLLKNKELNRRLFELSISQSVSEQIGYSLNIASIIESIVETMERVIEHSVVSYVLVEGKTITCRMFQKDFVGKVFVEDTKKEMLDKIYSLLPTETYHVIETVKKDFLHDGGIYSNTKPESHIVLPLMINHKCVGAISIASSQKNAFSKDDEELLRRIIENTSSAVSNLEQVIHTEEGKLDSFLFSLSSGALLFLLEKEVISLSAINTAAKQFLHLTEENPDTTMVIAHFGMHYDLVTYIKECAQNKKSMIIKNVNIYDRYFKIFLNPVFLHGEDIVLGVAVTMEDVTFERDIEQIRETFTNMVVHELRAPLTSIKGASAMLVSGKLNSTDSTKMLHIIHDSTDRMLADIGDILDVGKLEAGKFTLNKSLSDVTALIKDKVLAFSFLGEERHIKIISKLNSSIPQFIFDPQRIGQVLNNLLSNALKFTPDSGTITVATSLQNDKITVSVTDTGMGVPTDKIALLFSKYGQLSDSIRKEGGTGLGLYISKGIVESHGGKIWLNSEVGKGTMVAFSLPVVTKIDVPVESSSIPTSKVAVQRVVN